MKFTANMMTDGMMALLPLETMTTEVLTEVIEVGEEDEEEEPMIRVGGLEGVGQGGGDEIVDTMTENVKILVTKEAVSSPSRERTDSKPLLMFLLIHY